MRNSKFTKLLSVILASVLLFGTFASVISFAEDAATDTEGETADSTTKSAEIISKNLNYATRTEIVYAVEAKNVEETDSVVMLFWNEEKASDAEYTYANALYRKSFYGKGTVLDIEGCYLFASRGIAPKEINDSIYCRPAIRHVEIVEGETVVSYTYGSVLEYNVGMYAAEKLSESDNTEAQNKLYQSLLSYAEAAGEKFGAAAPSYVLAKVEDAQGSFGNFGSKYAIPDDEGTMVLRADAVNSEGKYFVKWVDADGNDVTTSRVARVSAPTEAGIHVYTPIWGEAADSAYAGSVILESFTTGEVDTGVINTQKAPTTACYDGSGLKRWTGSRTLNGVKFNFSAIPAVTYAEDGSYTLVADTNGFYVEEKRDTYHIVEEISGNKKIYAERTQGGAGYTVGFDTVGDAATEIMYTELDLAFDELTIDGVQVHVNVTLKNAAGTTFSVRSNLFSNKKGTCYIYPEGNNSKTVADENGETKYFDTHSGETFTLGIRLTSETVGEGDEAVTTYYIEYYINGEYFGRSDVALYKFSNTYKTYVDASYDISTAYMSYLSVNTVTAAKDDVILDNVSFSK